MSIYILPGIPRIDGHWTTNTPVKSYQKQGDFERAKNYSEMSYIHSFTDLHSKSVSVAYIPSLLTFTAVFLEDCVIRGIVTEFLNAKFGTNLNQF